MAMTKAEQKRMADLEHALGLARALRWCDYPEPATMTRAEIDAAKVLGGMKRYVREPVQEMVARGWFVNTYQNGSVTHGCSNGITHSSQGDTTSTQEIR